MSKRTSTRWLSVALVAIAGCTAGCSDSTHPTPVTATSPAVGAAARSSASSAAAPSASAVVATGPRCPLRPVAWAGWSPDGKWLLSAGAPEDNAMHEGPIKDGSVEIWDLGRGERTGSLDLGYPMQAGRTVVHAFSSDGHTALIAGPYGSTTATIAIGDLAAGSTRFVDGAIFPMSAEVSRDGKLGVVGGGATQVVTLELASGKVFARLPYSEGHSAAFSVFSSDGSVVLREDGEQNLSFLSTKTLDETRSMPAASGPDWTVPISPDHDKVAVLNDKGAAILDASTGKKLVTLKDGPAAVNPMDDLVWYAPTGRAVALVTSTDELYVWSAEDGARLAKVKVTLQDRKIQWSPDGAAIIAGREVIDAAKGTKLRDLEGTFVTWIKGHEIVEAAGGKLVHRGDAKAPIATWPAPELADSTTTHASASGSLVAYVPKGDTQLRVIRISDGAVVDLFTTTEHAGFAVRVGANKPQFDGTAAAKTCPAAQAGPGATARPGLLKDFLALRPLD